MTHWEKPLHWRFLQQGEEQTSEKTRNWLKEGKLKRETEALIIAAQDQTIRTNYVKTMIGNSLNGPTPKCRICKQSRKPLTIPQDSARNRRKRMQKEAWLCDLGDLLGPVRKMWIRVKWGLIWQCAREWQLQTSVVFTVITDYEIWARRSDLMINDNNNKRFQVIDMVIPEYAERQERWRSTKILQEK